MFACVAELVYCHFGSPNRRPSSSDTTIASSAGSRNWLPRAICVADGADERLRRVAAEHRHVGDVEVGVRVAVDVREVRAPPLRRPTAAGGGSCRRATPSGRRWASPRGRGRGARRTRVRGGEARVLRVLERLRPGRDRRRRSAARSSSRDLGAVGLTGSRPARTATGRSGRRSARPGRRHRPSGLGRTRNGPGTMSSRRHRSPRHRPGPRPTVRLLASLAGGRLLVGQRRHHHRAGSGPAGCTARPEEEPARDVGQRGRIGRPRGAPSGEHLVARGPVGGTMSAPR